MTLSQQLQQAYTAAQASLQRSLEHERYAALRAGLTAPRSRVIESEFMTATSSGFETQMRSAVPIEVPAEYPLQALRIDFAPGSYRFTIKVEGAGEVSLWAGDEPLVIGKRIFGETTLEIALMRSDVLRVESTSLISRVECVRYEGRRSGRLLLGPFHFEGLVSAAAVGSPESNFTVRVAKDEESPCQIALSSSGFAEAETTGPPWKGAPAAPPQGESLPWSTLSRVSTRSEIARPAFTTGSVVVGASARDLGELTAEEVPSVGDHVRIDAWSLESDAVYRLPRSRTPYGALLAVETAVLFGALSSSTGVVSSFSAITGEPSSPLVPGVHIVSAARIEDLELREDATLASSAHPLTEGEVEAAHARGQTLRYVEVSPEPRGMLVEVSGTGTLREIEFTVVTASKSPGAMPLTRTLRYDLSRHEMRVGTLHALTSGT